MTPCLFCNKEYTRSNLPLLSNEWCNACNERLTTNAKPEDERLLLNCAIKMSTGKCAVCNKGMEHGFTLSLNRMGKQLIDKESQHEMIQAEYWKDEFRIKDYFMFLVGCCKFTCYSCIEKEPIYYGYDPNRIMVLDVICIAQDKKRMDIFNKYGCALCNITFGSIWRVIKKRYLNPDVLFAKLSLIGEGIGFKELRCNNQDIPSCVVCLCAHCKQRSSDIEAYTVYKRTSDFVESRLLASYIQAPCKPLLNIVTLQGPQEIIKHLCRYNTQKNELVVRDWTVRHYTEIIKNSPGGIALTKKVRFNKREVTVAISVQALKTITAFG